MPYNLAWNKQLITATGAVMGSNVEVAGFYVSAAGTTTTLAVYDNTSAAGDPVVPTTATLSTGQFIPCPGGLPLNGPFPSIGVMFTTGVYVTVGGTGSPKIYMLWR
jgi:hypothetical protein